MIASPKTTFVGVCLRTPERIARSLQVDTGEVRYSAEPARAALHRSVYAVVDTVRRRLLAGR